ncbi:MAG: amino acid-binding protein [Bryobacteraceae bacterium]
MKIQQLSLFLENKPGHLLEPCRLLADAGVNIRTLTLADTQQFGILRMIVSDPAKATAVLKEKGYVVAVTEVLAVEVPDSPGGLAHMLETIAGSSVNIEYMYAFTFGRQGKAVLIFRFDDPDQAMTHLQRGGINVIDSVEIYNFEARG